MDDTRKVVALAAGIVILLGAAVGVYFLLTADKPVPAAAEPPPAEAAVQEVAAETPLEEDLLKLPPLELDKSDPILRQLVQDLSSHPRLFGWVKTSEIIRKFVAAVDNVANGLTPRAQVDFFSPNREFRVTAGSGSYYIDPAGYSRYNVVADVFVSLDTKASARLYRSLRPLIQDAYRDLGYPDQDFEETLRRAAAELLATPVVEGRIRVDKTVLVYKLADPNLEALSQAQKQFLRMGPENVQVIQKKLRELAVELGIPETRLPRARTYRPAN